MGENKEYFSFKKLLETIPHREPVDLHWLNANNVSSSYAARLAKAGYLQRLGSGVYTLKGATLDKEATLAWLAQQVPGMHVAAKTALSWRGVRHNLAFRETLTLWGNKQFKIPQWFDNLFPARYHTTQLFDSALPLAYGIGPVASRHPDLPVSSPERALLELFSEVGTHETYDEAMQLAESARHLRLDVLDTLMAHLTRIKVIRLATIYADELHLPWKDLAYQHSARMGGGDRWISSAGPSRQRLDLKRKA